MKLRKSQAGFSAVELVIIVVVLGVIAFVGYSVYNRQQDKKPTTETISQPTNDESATANDVKSAPTINSISDLDKATAILDQTDPSGSNNSDSSQIDMQLANF